MCKTNVILQLKQWNYYCKKDIQWKKVQVWNILIEHAWHSLTTIILILCHIIPQEHSNTYVIPTHMHVHVLQQALMRRDYRTVANLRKWIRANLHGLITLLFYKVINEPSSRLRAAWGGAEGLAGWINSMANLYESPALGPAVRTEEGCGFT